MATIAGEESYVALDSGDDPLDEHSLFEIGSVTKTMTGVLLADSIRRGEATAETTLSDALGVTGPASVVTLGQLATHRSGLPRLPPNLDPVNQANPYSDYAAGDLVTALGAVELGSNEFLYSNFGFMTLGLALARLARCPFETALHDRLFAPLGMASAGCPPATEDRVPGYTGSTRTPWWTMSLPGAGGVGASIRDLCAYLRAHVDPPGGTIGEAIQLATTIHAEAPSPAGYGWAHRAGGWWPNGATGGFRSFVAFHRPSRAGVALLANSVQAESLDGVGFATLKEMVK